MILINVFQRKYDEVPPTFITLTLLYSKELGICCNIFFGSWCILFSRNSHQIRIRTLKKGNNWRNLSINFQHQHSWVSIIFSIRILLNLILLEIIYSSSCIIFTKKSHQYKLEDWNCAFHQHFSNTIEVKFHQYGEL